MPDDSIHPDDEEIVRLLHALPRTAPLSDGAADELVEKLRGEGFFGPRRRVLMWSLRAAAAAAIFALGALAGARYAQRNSLEEMLARQDLTLTERVLLLQRAGSAYVRAADAYADATSQVDSGAVEVASHVLMGAAHAIARRTLDSGLAARLSTAIVPVNNAKPVLWF